VIKLNKQSALQMHGQEREKHKTKKKQEITEPQKEGNKVNNKEGRG
jgi:hypothetical protein